MSSSKWISIFTLTNKFWFASFWKTQTFSWNTDCTYILKCIQSSNWVPFVLLFKQTEKMSRLYVSLLKTWKEREKERNRFIRKNIYCDTWFKLSLFCVCELHTINTREANYIFIFKTMCQYSSNKLVSACTAYTNINALLYQYWICVERSMCCVKIDAFLCIQMQKREESRNNNKQTRAA